ncbi:hypothetical protein HPB47_000337 [Ixodes persulcatus]|uniref:Uncharacterized protein n=1 Tax=Ixodes persulcatus TaxID=34615 RepID=A0AC60PSF0_IXOPE|nr:hypothetical protein HPB47_000337 [Ixodes persulcatus]
MSGLLQHPSMHMYSSLKTKIAPVTFCGNTLGSQLLMEARGGIPETSRVTLINKRFWESLRFLPNSAEPKATLRQQIQKFIHNVPGKSEKVQKAVKIKIFGEHPIQGIYIYPNYEGEDNP